MNTKKIIAITTVATFAMSGLAGAQASSTQAQNDLGFRQKIMNTFNKFTKGKDAKENKDRKDNKGMGMGMKVSFDRKAIDAAIVAGNFSLFQQLASTSPLKAFSQANFNLLTPQFNAKINAETQIKNILTAAGISASTTPGFMPFGPDMDRDHEGPRGGGKGFRGDR